MPFCWFCPAAQLIFALHSSYAIQYLQPDISKYASEILPLLFQYLLQVSQDAEKNPKGLTRSYYALEMFCENLGKNGGNIGLSKFKSSKYLFKKKIKWKDSSCSKA